LRGFEATAAHSSLRRLRKWGGGLSRSRITGRAEFRLRIGDYRLIYDFDTKKNEIYLIAPGNRREVYR